MSTKYPAPTHKNPSDLRIRDLKVPVDVLSFTGEESLSKPFVYRIRFTSAIEKKVFTGSVRVTQEDLLRKSQPQISPTDIDSAAVINQYARFALYGKAPAPRWRGAEAPEHKPLREIYGVVTAFHRTGGSVDEGHYEITLEPRFGLLSRGKQYRIYQHKSVPEIVESILRSRHFMAGHDFLFDFRREYPRREQVMQYGESDLEFVDRLLAEVGIWYRVGINPELHIDVVYFHDWQCHLQFDITLPSLPQGGLSSTDKDSVWNLGTRHTLVEKDITFRTYDPRQAELKLQGELTQRNLETTTFGETYEYALPFTQTGARRVFDDWDPLVGAAPETGHFFARLNNERNLTRRSVLTGTSSSATLGPGQVLTVTGDVPQDFAKNVLIHTLSLTGARDRAFEAKFEGMPYSEFVCYRPALKPKPRMAGTVPARISSTTKRDPYSHINKEGRYRVNFLFDRDEWGLGRESAWLRLARPYAGDSYGLHLPLVAGTEVAVAFEQGDPDRPYIAHALHDSRHVDHVTSGNHKRNVLRTPANNKLRMEDERGKEHVKLSTEHSGKSQLNLGHLVNAKREKRGEGFELRTDAWGSLRAGKGVFISADAQSKAQGQVLEMGDAVARLHRAGEQMESLCTDAQVSQADPADLQSQLALLKDDLAQLKSAVLLLSAPKGIALTSGKHLQLAAQDNLMLNAGGHGDISVMKRLFIGVGQGLSLFVRKVGIKLIANQGPVQIQAQNDTLTMMAREGLEIISTEDEIRIVAKKKITLNAGGSYISLDASCIESGTAGDYNVKAAQVSFTGPASMGASHQAFPTSQLKQPLRFSIAQTPNMPSLSWSGMPYQLFAGDGLVGEGVLDDSGQIQIDHQVVTQAYRLVLSNGVSYQLPVPSEYANAEQAGLANGGFQNHRSETTGGIALPQNNTEQRARYAALLKKPEDVQGES